MKPGRFIAFAFLFFAGTAFGQNRLIDSLQKVVARGKKDSLEVVASLELANEFSRSNIPVAKQYVLASISLARKLSLPNRLSAAYSVAATIFSQINKTDSARYYIDQLKKLGDDTHISYVISNYYFTEGLFYRRQGNYKASIPFMKEALRLFKIQNDKLSMAGQDLNIGNNYSDMGDYRNSMAFRLEALKLFEELGNKRGISFCYSNIAVDFIRLKQYTEALSYAQRSIALKTELNDKRGLSNTYVTLGEVQNNLHKPGEALGSFMHGLELVRGLKLPIEEGKTDLEIAKFYEDQKDIENARRYLDYSTALFKQLGDTAYMSVANAEAANLQNTIAHQQSTEKVFLNTLNTAVKMGDKSTELNNYKHLSDFYAQNKQYEKALDYNEKYHSKQDSLQNSQLQLQVKELEQRYNIEKKEKEISLLKKDQLLYKANLQNQKIFRYGTLIVLLMLLAIGFLVIARYRVVQKAKRLLEMEKMRNSIARNLHDDIGSTLSSINILSKVALEQAGGNVNVTSGLEKIKSSSYTIMESMSDIVWAINPANDHLENTILKMKEFAITILEPAGISFAFNEESQLADLKLGVDERKNLYLIFKEAINNIAKYSGASRADIEVKKIDSQFSIRITDNGKGFDGSKQYNGNGLKNMRSRAAEMNADFNISTKPAEGTSICVVLAIT
ncbi:tetratricopeptide repeat-containing sensor histidine kinase [uncultured Mucilaginibacter sp.]|uniref:tetratricopeptide repeat-containing sensor histidine kinase n=1 Tax=uncultured Mucilaginibacter sp. TaxID=797541 RepID=UPI0025EFBE88|nr:tetratricopeptide repeat-containing sensor histidine kinase [uncultured Mucilaginibacter sp.]